jgi:hypothetical protein
MIPHQNRTSFKKSCAPAPSYHMSMSSSAGPGHKRRFARDVAPACRLGQAGRVAPSFPIGPPRKPRSRPLPPQLSTALTPPVSQDPVNRFPPTKVARCCSVLLGPARWCPMKRRQNVPFRIFPKNRVYNRLHAQNAAQSRTEVVDRDPPGSRLFSLPLNNPGRATLRRAFPQPGTRPHDSTLHAFPSSSLLFALTSAFSL